MGKEIDTKRISAPRRRSKKGNKQEKFEKLKSLPCFNELDMRIKAGISIDEVARWLQEDMFQMTDIQFDSLKRQLYRYKSSLPPAELMNAVEDQPFVRKAVEKMKRGVNEIEELERLYLFQLQRISRDAETEAKINKLFKGTNKEIELATNMLEKIVRLKMELGVVDKAPDQLNIGGLIGHMPVVPDQLQDEQTADKTMTRMGLIASKLFKAVEDIAVEEPAENVIDAECEEIES